MISIGNYNEFRDPAVIKKRNKLAQKIVKEHFEMTLGHDRNINYLWYMYHTGSKKGTFKPFIFIFEINLLLSLNIITPEEKTSIIAMLNSEDDDNKYLGILAIENLMNKRIKIHGKWTKDQDVSDDFKDVVLKYPVLITELYLNV